ncbi:DHA2 family efflux MFS transporter permease subunit [Paenibacillus hexagrammi]|uniref:DHA2 family efflux MFS transporter permease subunit n=1 Tax=Paenibacillus hexagrammi TaxID=2908839 RepID=A0ABY3SM77_9BACL|nr:DHA2 family efflux MFS transporter permease subunit [Paenibacillus sp. YPD9-1]UJF34186.1 DHA2 family efflux MFS transporter permease subunit [Paenibacillus sp. YPD9-1]
MIVTSESSSASLKPPAADESINWVALTAIILGTFVSVLNNSLLNVALPKLVNVFGSTTQDIQWVLTGYMLASAVVVPMSGYMADRFGAKRIFVLALTGFTLGSLLCGFAWSASSLIAFRIIQGIFGGFIGPICMTIVYSIVPRSKIGMALGLWGVAAMAAPAIGPTLSGYLIQYFTWRLLFFISVPVGIFAIVVSFLVLKEMPIKSNLKFDLPGCILSVLCFGSLLLALSKGQSEGWTSLYIISLLYIAFFSMCLLIWVELGKEQPLLDFSFFKNPTFTLSLIAGSLVMVGLYGGTFLTPLYLQNVQGQSPLQTGIIMLPQSLAMALMMPISGRLFDKIGVVPLALTGLALMSVTTFELHLLSQYTSNHWLDAIMTVRGLGIGMCMMPLTTVGMNAVARERVGRASSLSNVIRQVAGSLSIAVLTAIMTNQQTLINADISSKVTVTSDAVSRFMSTMTGYFMASGMDSTYSQASAVTVLAGMIAKESLVRAIGETFMISSMPLFLCIPIVFFFIKRKKKSEAPAPAPEAPAASSAPEQNVAPEKAKVQVQTQPSLQNA